MEPSVIAASVVALLTPYLKKAAEEFAGEAGKGAATFVQEKAKAIWERLRKAFSADPSATAALNRFEADPNAAKDEAEAQIASQIARDNGLQTELAAAIAEVKRAAPQIRVVQNMKEAEEVVGLKAKRMTRGSAEVSQHMDKAKKVTGADFDEIG
ncbi:hypothetical protein WN73_37750 [Bradyrhizobium sp. CCBAU 45394]|nr:hypothetical protein [Bradyrhizobium sp. CCBAU 45394]